MKKIALLLFCVVTSLSTLSNAQVSDLQLQAHLEQNSKLYAVFNQRPQTQHLSNEMLQSISYRVGNYSPTAANDDIVKSKGLLFCAEVGAGMILVKGKLYACEIFDIVGQKIGKNNFLWAYSFDFELRSERSKVLDSFKGIIKKGMTILKLNELFNLSGTVGMTVGYTWGDDYGQYKDLTLKKGFLGTQFEVVNGWGAGLKILSPNLAKDKIKMVLGSVMYGDEGTEIGSQVIIKFRKGIQLKSLVN
jgi:hypothetical protein